MKCWLPMVSTGKRLQQDGILHYPSLYHLPYPKQLLNALLSQIFKSKCKSAQSLKQTEISSPPPPHGVKSSGGDLDKEGV